MGSKQVNLVLT